MLLLLVCVDLKITCCYIAYMYVLSCRAVEARYKALVHVNFEMLHVVNTRLVHDIASDLWSGFDFGLVPWI